MNRMVVVVVALLLVLPVSCRRQEKTADPQPAQREAAEKSGGDTAAPGTDIGSTMPEYAAIRLDGSKFELASTRNKVVLLNIWATWCGPCRAEIPELQKLHDKYAPQGFEVLGVSVDESGVEPVREFVTEHKMTYPVVVDLEGGKIASIFQTNMIPTSAIIDRNGKIVWKRFGLIPPNDQELEKAIEAAL